MAGRLIFHCDGNNFFASCECIEHPEWRDVPMAVAGDPKDRCGIVVAKNELAKKAGVKTTDTIWQARQKCPNILFVPPHHDEYARVSRRMNAIFREYTDFVEPASIDESYLDMTGGVLRAVPARTGGFAPAARARGNRHHDFRGRVVLQSVCENGQRLP